MAEALERLSPEHRAVIQAMYYEGQSVADAARKLSVPEGTVKSRAYYAVRALRTVFEERKEKTMFIMGAGTLRYGEIVEVIDVAKGAGVEKVGIVTEGMRRAGGD